ncbi:hypothetical protein C4K27_3270 [Pseudomonas chlororaphis subsp. chlororaphis]|nr:hypothetical protein C4K27_3270 [Pseudomonas chlororaphis subsp. chlororaphis]
MGNVPSKSEPTPLTGTGSLPVSAMRKIVCLCFFKQRVGS